MVEVEGGVFAVHFFGDDDVLAFEHVGLLEDDIILGEAGAPRQVRCARVLDRLFGGKGSLGDPDGDGDDVHLYSYLISTT